jgi:hypothetical protein
MSIALERHSSEVYANLFMLLACSYVQIPHSTVHNVLYKRLHLKAYKIQMIHALKPSDQVVQTNSTVDMLDLYVLPQLPPQTTLQQDGAPPHFCHHVRNHLNREMAGRWIGRGGPIAS